MKAIILERREEWAAALREDGIVVRTRAAGEVGEQVELDEKVVEFPSTSPALQKHRWRRTAIAAALILALAGGSATYYTTAMAASYVSVDVEDASVELSINRLGQVISVTALNQESTQLAQELETDLRRVPVETAVERTMDRLDSDQAQDVILGVTGDEKLTQKVDKCVRQRERVYALEGSRDDRKKAREKGMSPGKFLAEREFRREMEQEELSPQATPPAWLREDPQVKERFPRREAMAHTEELPAPSEQQEPPAVTQPYFTESPDREEPPAGEEPPFTEPPAGEEPPGREEPPFTEPPAGEEPPAREEAPSTEPPTGEEPPDREEARFTEPPARGERPDREGPSPTDRGGMDQGGPPDRRPA